MADAQFGEGRQFNLHSAGTDLVEGSALAVTGATGAITVNGVTETGSSAGVALMVGGGTPHDSVDSGNPLKIGGKAASGTPTAVVDGDRVNGWFNLNGAQGSFLAAGPVSGSTAGVSGLSTDGLNIVGALHTASAVMVSTGAGFNRGRDGISISDGDGTGSLATAPAVFNGTTWDRLRGNTTGLFTQGVAAHDSVFAGRPMAVGAYASSTAPTAVSANGDVVNLWASLNGSLNVVLRDTSGAAAITAAAALSDTLANPTTGLLGTSNMLWNTTNWERWRSVVGLGDAATTGIASSSNFVFNGTNWDRQRSVLGVTAGANTDVGIAASGVGPGFARIPANATLASGQSATISTKGAGTATFDVTGSFTGAASQWEATTDDSNWFAIKLINLATGAQEATGPTAAAGGRWSLGEVSRYRQVRLRMTALTTGSVTVAMTANPMPRYMAVEGDVAHNQADDGSPIKIGGKGKSGTPTPVAGDVRTDAWFSLYGALAAATVTGTPDSGSDAVGPVIGAVHTSAASYTAGPPSPTYLFNGTNWDRARSGGVTGMAGVGGATAADAAIAANPLTIGGRASAAVPTAMSADGDVVNAWLDRAGRFVTRATAGTGTQTNVAAAAADTSLLAANTSRLGFTVHNDSTAILYLLVGSGTASTTVFTVKMAAGAYYECPSIGYTGAVRGIWASATGSARITEYT